MMTLLVMNPLHCTGGSAVFFSSHRRYIFLSVGSHCYCGGSFIYALGELPDNQVLSLTREFRAFEFEYMRKTQFIESQFFDWTNSNKNIRTPIQLRHLGKISLNKAEIISWISEILHGATVPASIKDFANDCQIYYFHVEVTTFRIKLDTSHV